MKKLLIVILILLALLAGFIYFFIPPTLLINSSVNAKANPDAVFQALHNDSVWKKCWPGTVSASRNGKYQFEKGGFTFFIKEARLDFMEVSIVKKNDTIPSFFYFSPQPDNNVQLLWKTAIRSGKNPLTKMDHYLIALKLKGVMREALSSFESFVEEVKNMYGFPIRSQLVAFQYIMSTRITLDHYPSLQEIYGLVDEVKKYVDSAGGKAIGDPMLNVHLSESKSYQVQVGIPVSAQLPDTDKISAKWMLKGGDILITEVTGGNSKIEEAMRMTEKYITDYHHTIIAIPFQSMVTDRRSEPDTNKWKTLIYYPVVM